MHVEGGTNEQKGARVRADQGLDDPEADVCQTPDADLLGLPTTDEDPLRQDRNGAHNEETRDAGQEQSNVDVETIRPREDPLVACANAERSKVGISEEEQELQRSADDVLQRARRCRLDRCWNRRLGRARRDVRERRCQASDRRMPVDVPHRYRRQVPPLPHPCTEMGHHQRVRTQLVEAVALDGQAVDAQEVSQHLAENPLGAGRRASAPILDHRRFSHYVSSFKSEGNMNTLRQRSAIVMSPSDALTRCAWSRLVPLAWYVGSCREK